VVLQGVGLAERLIGLLCKIKIIAAKCKEAKTGCSLVESSKDGYGKKKTLFYP
jgi:hypothetical protein